MSARALFLRIAPRLFARWCDPDPRELGLLGEELAARALVGAGLEIRARRTRIAGVEIDILARDGADLVCVEVKTSRVLPLFVPRGSDLDPLPPPFRPAGRLGRVQIARLSRAARALGSAAPNRARVDRVEVLLNARTGRVRVQHARDVLREMETRSRFPHRGWNGAV